MKIVFYVAPAVLQGRIPTQNIVEPYIKIKKLNAISQLQNEHRVTKTWIF